jgi:hypothetical protein
MALAPMLTLLGVPSMASMISSIIVCIIRVNEYKSIRKEREKGEDKTGNGRREVIT